MPQPTMIILAVAVALARRSAPNVRVRETDARMRDLHRHLRGAQFALHHRVQLDVPRRGPVVDGQWDFCRRHFLLFCCFGGVEKVFE